MFVIHLFRIGSPSIDLFMINCLPFDSFLIGRFEVTRFEAVDLEVTSFETFRFEAIDLLLIGCVVSICLLIDVFDFYTAGSLDNRFEKWRMLCGFWSIPHSRVPL